MNFKNISLLSLICLMLAIAGCRNNQQKESAAKDIFAKSNLLAWCIVPYDNQERGPEARAEMMEDLGITMFAYDWRDQHLANFDKEIDELRDHDIKLQSVWFWIDGDTNRLFNENNEKILQTLENKNVETQLWVSFPGGFFEGLTGQEKFDKALLALEKIHDRATQIGCTVGLYNHGGWFGDPENQIKLIKALNKEGLGIVYNFHHAHEQIEEFPGLLDKMMPYLYAVNINGMKKDGPKILPVGQGDHEQAMLQTLKKSGYEGPVGILGHIKERDAKKVLQENMQGLRQLTKKGEMGNEGF